MHVYNPQVTELLSWQYCVNKFSHLDNDFNVLTVTAIILMSHLNVHVHVYTYIFGWSLINIFRLFLALSN